MPRAQRILGRCYEYGDGVEKDMSRAMELYTLAAAQEYAPALCDLGLCCEFGTGTAKDLPKAAELYTRAAHAGKCSCAV